MISGMVTSKCCLLIKSKLSWREDTSFINFVRMYREQYAALPAAVGANEAAVRGGLMQKKLEYFEAQLSDIVDGYRESLLKALPDLYAQKANGFALSVKRALSDELRRGAYGKSACG